MCRKLGYTEFLVEFFQIFKALLHECSICLTFLYFLLV